MHASVSFTYIYSVSDRASARATYLVLLYQAETVQTPLLPQEFRPNRRRSPRARAIKAIAD